MENLLEHNEQQTRPVEVILGEMQEIASPGLTTAQLEESPATVEGLKDATYEMLMSHGEEARRVYERYIDTETRSLTFSPEAHTALAEMFGGKNVLVTGATGVIADPVLKQLQ